MLDTVITRSPYSAMMNPTHRPRPAAAFRRSARLPGLPPVCSGHLEPLCIGAKLPGGGVPPECGAGLPGPTARMKSEYERDIPSRQGEKMNKVNGLGQRR
jgi:hypothetical protein